METSEELNDIPSFDYKDSSQQRYDLKFKNKGKLRTRHSGHAKVGNARSLAASRPSVPTERVATNMDNEDICNYKAIDRRIPIHDKFDRKTYAKGLVSMDVTPKLNQQRGNIINPKFPRALQPRIVCLSEIRDKLCLTNFDWMTEKLSEFCNSIRTNITIINLSGEVIDNRSRNVTIINLKLSEVCNYKVFEANMLGILNEIQNIPEKDTIIITCSKGVVRSVATVMCLAMITIGMSYDESLRLINRKKEEVDPLWASMTNNSFKNFVRAFGGEHRKIENTFNSTVVGIEFE